MSLRENPWDVESTISYFLKYKEKDSVTAKMEMTASMMLNSPPPKDLMQSRMSSFPSSESLSSAVSWKDPTEAYKEPAKIYVNGSVEVYDQTQYVKETLAEPQPVEHKYQDSVEAFHKSKVDMLPEQPVEHKYQDVGSFETFHKIKVDMLPEKYGFIKKHVKYLIKGPVISDSKV